MDREKEFRKNNWMRKVIYFLLTFLTYGVCYAAMAFLLEAVNLIFPISPYVQLILYLIFFVLDRFLTVHIMNMKWVNSIILQM